MAASLVACALAASGLVAAGCGTTDSESASSTGGSSGANKPVAMKVASAGGLKQGLYIWDLYAAIDNGFFKKRGLDVSVVSTDSGSTAVQAMSAGAADAAGGISADSFIDAIDAGGSVKLGAFTQLAENQVIASRNVKGWPDLAGKKVGSSTPALTGSDILLVQLMKLNGLTPKDVKITALGASPQKVQAFRTGAIDGVMLSAPYNQDALKAPGSHVIANTWDHPETSWPFIAIGFSSDFVSAHPQAAKAFVDAYQEAHDWLRDPANKEKAVAMLVKYTGVAQSSAEATYDVVFNKAHTVLEHVGVTDDLLTRLLKALGKPSDAAALEKYKAQTLPSSLGK